MAVSPTKPAANGGRSQTNSPQNRDYYNCGDFSTQAEAQRILNSTPRKDPYKLDSDGEKYMQC